MNSTKLQILHAVGDQSNGHLQTAALHTICSVADCSESTARRYLNELKREGLIASTSYCRRSADRYYIREEKAASDG